jgi:hypothetical protein
MRPLALAVACGLASCAPGPSVESVTPAVTTAAPTAVEPRGIEWNGSKVVLASLDEARSVLGTSDAFTRTMGDFDRGVRMGTDAPSTEQAFLEHAAAQAREWPPEVGARWAATATEVGEALRGLGLRFPSRVLLVVSSGKEEMSAPYTRGNAIIIPMATATRLSDPFQLVSHEMFHLASRHDPAIRDAL